MNYGKGLGPLSTGGDVLVIDKSFDPLYTLRGNQQYGQAIKKHLSENPLFPLKLIHKKLLYLWNIDYGVGLGYSGYLLKNNIILAFAVLIETIAFSFIYVLIFGIFVFNLFKKSKNDIIKNLSVIIFLYLSIFYGLLYSGNSRYHFLILPLLTLYSAKKIINFVYKHYFNQENEIN